jgi:hypothetical protein
MKLVASNMVIGAQVKFDLHCLKWLNQSFILLFLLGKFSYFHIVFELSAFDQQTSMFIISLPLILKIQGPMLL